MPPRSSRVSAFSSRVWGGWALGLIGGLFFLAFGLVGLVGTPDLFQATEAVNPVWFPLVLSLAVGGACLVLASALVAERRHRNLRDLHEVHQAHRKRTRNRVVMGLYELTFDDDTVPGGTRWSILALLALLGGVVGGAVLVALGMDPLALVPLP